MRLGRHGFANRSGNVRFVKKLCMLQPVFMTVMGIVSWYAAISPSCRWRLAWGLAYILNTGKKQNPPKGKKGSKAMASAE